MPDVAIAEKGRAMIGYPGYHLLGAEIVVEYLDVAYAVLERYYKCIFADEILDILARVFCGITLYADEHKVAGAYLFCIRGNIYLRLMAAAQALYSDTVIFYAVSPLNGIVIYPNVFFCLDL